MMPFIRCTIFQNTKIRVVFSLVIRNYEEFYEDYATDDSNNDDYGPGNDDDDGSNENNDDYDKHTTAGVDIYFLSHVDYPRFVHLFLSSLFLYLARFICVEYPQLTRLFYLSLFSVQIHSDIHTVT